MKYRLIAIDLDGTLVPYKKSVSDADRAAIQRAQEVGCLVVPATGRGWREAIDALAPVPGLSLGVFNTGAVIAEVASGRLVELAYLEPELTLGLISSLRHLPQAVLVSTNHQETGHHYLVSGDGQLCEETVRWFELCEIRTRLESSPRDDDVRHAIRVSVIAQGSDLYHAEKLVLERFGDRVHAHAFAGAKEEHASKRVHFLEIFRAGIDKWHGITWIARQHDIPLNEIAVIGDDINDVPMLRCAGLGVAMASGHPNAIAAADRQTPSVAHAIDRMLDVEW